MLLTIFIWIILSFLIAVGAKNRGKSFIGYLFLSLFLSPVVGLIAVLMITDNQKSD